MISIKSSLLIGCTFLLVLSSSAYADPLSIEETQEEDARTITTNNGNVLLNFNATNIVLIAAVIGIGLIGIVAIATLFSTGASSGYNSYQNRFSNTQGQYEYYDEPLHYQKRSVNDVAHQLYALAEAFKKYEVEESCQKYVACAARRNTESYALMNIVDDVMKAMLKSGHEKIRAKDAYVGELMDAYLQGERTSCQQHKSICYRKKFN
eukprot:TRINITY_DN1613_c0_g1_i1.p1 TRINITY_DN1613_c0_g1~~TRINITY_DN1613_c0_g1_i1.p1  ORF type:complete len:208 (+),score=67.36 TRINITY_DN1613_c0_g1_i1:175-798(+)